MQAICDLVHRHLRFDYLKARANRTALDGFRERVGVCRDFTHLAIALCRCMNIPGLKDPADVLGKTDADLFAPEHAQVALRDEQEIQRTDVTALLGMLTLALPWPRPGR